MGKLKQLHIDCELDNCIAGDINTCYVQDRDYIKQRLEIIRQSIHDENISYGELAELQSLADYIDDGDTELLEWANVPEHDE